MAAKLLTVDDEPEILRVVEKVFSKDYEVLTLDDPTRALARVEETEPDCVLLDVDMPGMSGIQVLEALHGVCPELPVIMLTGVKDVQTAVSALRLGAYDYQTKPPNFEELTRAVARAIERTALQSEVRRLRGELGRAHGIPNIIGRHPAMLAVYDVIGRVSSRHAPVLIRGESGTGKELVARAIHQHGSRSAGPFVAVNCAAVPDSLFEAEFFGHERGAYTDAKSARAGYFEQATGGTLFLDEVGELALTNQAKLLRALQEREVTRLGSGKAVPVDVRIICATNRALEEAVERGELRQDLYYRINVIPVDLPPLRERRSDIPLLVGHFVARIARTEGEAPKAVSAEALRKLQAYPWPGNVRELENLVERLMAMVPGDAIDAEHLPGGVATGEPEGGSIYEAVLAGEVGLTEAVQQLEQQVILEALRRSGGNKSAAAALIGISRRMLRYKLGQWKLEGVPGDEGEGEDEGDGG